MLHSRKVLLERETLKLAPQQVTESKNPVTGSFVVICIRKCTDDIAKRIPAYAGHQIRLKVMVIP